jgi:two-component system alkaline phosphatase synthesis response regulator PhoP
MLTAKGDETDRVVGLELGADDYISKPFSARELTARIKAVLRLAQKSGESAAEGKLQIDERITINTRGRTSTVEGKEIELTPKEFELLAHLVENRGKMMSRDTLLESVWGFDFLGESRTVDVHVHRLRKKIKKDPQDPKYLLTVPTIGYKFRT